MAEETAIFGRVSPHQKKLIIQTLKKAGHTTAMTGDGVNDILALREADCSIVMAEWSRWSFIKKIGAIWAMLLTTRRPSKRISGTSLKVRVQENQIGNLTSRRIPFSHHNRTIRLTKGQDIINSIPCHSCCMTRFFQSLDDEFLLMRGNTTENSCLLQP